VKRTVNAATRFADAVKTLFGFTVRQVFGDNAVRISECGLRVPE
jgi:hypothetical protein